MAHKRISVMVLLGLFQDFDHGKEIVQHEENLDLAPGDTFDWNCAQFDGMAQTVSYQDGKLTFKKIF